jgi:hypothetical protein
VGFKLPSAGVTPAPSTKKESEIARTRFRSRGSKIGNRLDDPDPDLPLSEGRSAPTAGGAGRGATRAVAPGRIFLLHQSEGGGAAWRRTQCRSVVIRRVGVGALSGAAPHPATPLRGFRRPLLGQGEVIRSSDGRPGRPFRGAHTISFSGLGGLLFQTPERAGCAG